MAGSIGPLPSQPQYEATVEAMIVEQAEGLMEGGADFILFETQPNRAALERCAAAMCRLPDVPFVLSFAITGIGETASGESVERMLAPLPPGVAQPIAWGMNCGVGPDGLLGAVEQAVRLTTLPLIVQPNAGMPREVENRRIYLCSPEYLVSYAKRYVALGASAVGGCCGTTPEHIREVALAIKPLGRAKVLPPIAPAAGVEPKTPAPLAEKSQLGARLANRQWITTVELLPPRGYDLQSTVEKANALRERGVGAINIPDGPRASARLSSLVAAERILREARIEPILHFCCRDRNLIGMQADLLACAACGVRNILFVTGDPPKLGDYPQATGVFDADSIGMAAVQRRLNCGIDLGGQAIDPPTFAVIGVGLDPTALDQRPRVGPFPSEGRGGGRVRHHAAGLRPRRPVADSRRGRASRRSDHRRHLAAGELPQCVVHAERGAGRGGARRGDGADGLGRKPRGPVGHGHPDRPRVGGPGARSGGRHSGERPVRQHRGGLRGDCGIRCKHIRHLERHPGDAQRPDGAFPRE